MKLAMGSCLHSLAEVKGKAIIWLLANEGQLKWISCAWISQIKLATKFLGRPNCRDLSWRRRKGGCRPLLSQAREENLFSDLGSLTLNQIEAISHDFVCAKPRIPQTQLTQGKNFLQSAGGETNGILCPCTSPVSPSPQQHVLFSIVSPGPWAELQNDV